MLAGCSHKKIAAPGTPPALTWPVKSPDFIDLVPGVVREVTPIFTSGAFVIPRRPQEPGPGPAEGNVQQGPSVITLEGTDFEGYETVLYTLKPRNGGGIEVALTSVEITKGDQTTAAAKPRVLLFQFPRRVRYIRLLYLIRVSESDHNMAVLGSDDVDRLNAFTKEVQSDPTAGCKNARRAFCSWVPQGIAVNSVLGR